MKSKPVQEITNKLAAVRTARGLSAAALASMVHVSRQTIYAIEKGSFVPNTTVALRLAHALAVRVDEIFCLPEPQPQPTTANATLLPCFQGARAGQSVQLCKVDGRVLATVATPLPWFLPASDGAIAECRAGRNGARIHLHRKDPSVDNRLLLAGCDPAMTLIGRHLQSAGLELIIVHQNSSQALSLLKQGLVHIAGIHLGSESARDTNVTAVSKLFVSESMRAISFAMGEEGLVVASGNPKQIRGVEDLTRGNIRFLNRERGAGSRYLLDRHLKHSHIDPKRVPGYDRTASGHLAAAWEVNTGLVDCCVGTRAAANLFGLAFLPLENSRYDLVVRRRHLDLPAVQVLFDVINRSSFRLELNSIGGYSAAVTGNRVI